MIDKELWKNPSVDFRPIPLWVWNEKQEPSEMKRQIWEMKEQGFGGFFMHARIGLKTEYLGDEWFEHVRLCTEEAERLGMKVWIYDEDRWPSGFAGGQIDTGKMDYAARGLRCHVDSNGGRTFEIFKTERNSVLNNAYDPDNLNPEVVAEFIKLTHDKYRDAIGKHFGKTVPGTFTDEPSYVLWGHDDKFKCIPWTEKMEEIFKEKLGYDLKPHLAELFFDEGDYRRVRIDFYRTVTELLSANFAKQIYDWSEKNGILSTGHMMMEDSLLSQVRSIGAAMPHYEYFHIPGIDHLGNLMPDAPLLQKQCASVARQLGQRRVLSELFGAAGWEATIGSFKVAGDYDYALGINFLNQHMAYYSIKGRRKRDYPTSCSYHIPGYELYQPFNDYFTRLSYALSQGKNVCKILVLHPISSAWSLYSPLNPKPVQDLDREFAELCANLLRIQRDYDFGDEMLMEKYAKVADGRFIIGEASYEAVVIPPSENMSLQTFELLRKFAVQGGRIVAVGRLPESVDGRPSEELKTFIASAAVTRIGKPDFPSLRKSLESISCDVTVTEAGGKPVEELIYQHRSDGDKDLYFLTFGRKDKSFRAQISLEGEGVVEWFEADKVSLAAVPAVSENGRTIFEMDVTERGSLLLMLDRSRTAMKTQNISKKVQIKSLDGDWKIERLEPNVLLIERCRMKCYESPWSEPMGIAGGGGLAILPNAHDLLEMAFENKYLWRDWPVYLRFEFKATLGRGKNPPMSLVIEDPIAMSDFKANGNDLSVSKNEYWLDRQFRKVDLKGALHSGLNKIDCRVKWERPTIPGTMRFTPNGSEIENVYLIGDFNVACKGASTSVLSAESLPSDPSANLAIHGLPFYYGTIRYEKKLTIPEIRKGARYILKFPKPDGEGIRLSVNGKRVSLLWYEPFEADCTEFLHRGVNIIQADLFSNMGNLLGTLHHKLPWMDPAHYRAGYNLRPLGLGGIPELIVS
jgi:hypothetical protein